MMHSIFCKILFRDNLFRSGTFLQITRLGSVQTVIFKPRDFEEREREARNLKCGKKYALVKVEELLGVRKYTALDLVMKNKKLWEVPGYQMDENYKICQNEDIKNATCIKYPELLGTSDLSMKINILRNIPAEINEVAPLAIMPMKDLMKFIGTDEKITTMMIRVKEMCRLVKTSPETIYESFVKRPFLKKLNLERLAKNVKILTEHGITTDEIVKDWWVVQYNTNTIELRLDLAKEANIDKLKTWMVRSQVDIFENYVKRRSENKQILGDNTLAEYLSIRLDCSIDQAKSFMAKMPALKHKSMKKLQDIIDFLYSEGFKPYHICRVPKILLHSVETTRKRLRELEKQGVQMESLHMLTKSQKQYMPYYEALVKSNKNKIKAT